MELNNPICTKKGIERIAKNQTKINVIDNIDNTLK